MGKKNQNPMQRQPIKPSAIVSSRDKQALKALAASLTPKERDIMADVWNHPKVQVLVGAAEAESRVQEIVEQLTIVFDANLEFERMILRLARRCDKIDVLVGAELDKQKLQDALSGDLRQAIEDDYDDVVEEWKARREFMTQTNQGDLGEFGIIYHTGVKKMVDDRLAALDALADGDDSLIRALPPLDHDTDKLLNPVAKSGRKSKKDDLLTTEAKRLKDEGMSHAGILNHLRNQWGNSTDSDEVKALQLITRRPGDKSDDATIDEAAKELIKKRLKRAQG